jgi:hypothetical protein
MKLSLGPQSSFIQCHPYNNANLMTFTCRKQLIFRALLENIIDDLNGIDYAGLKTNEFHDVLFDLEAKAR